MVDRSPLWSFVGVLRQHWFAAMSGGFSVPFTGAMVYFDSKYTQSIFAFLALASLYFAAYRIWKSEHDKVAALQVAAAAQANELARLVSGEPDAKSKELAGVINAMMERALGYNFSFPLANDDSFVKHYSEIEKSDHVSWADAYLRQLRREFLIDADDSALR
jgi:hypothetical protein